MSKTPVVEQVQVNFRMPVDLKARIEAAAKVNNRSTTSEIVATLEDKYPPPLPPGTVEFLRSILDRTPNMPEADRQILQCMLDELNGPDLAKAESAARMFIEGFVEAARASPPARFYKLGDDGGSGRG